MISSSSLNWKLALVSVAVCGAASIWAASANNDPYAGQYDVATTPKHSTHDYRQGELIVKLRTENTATPLRLKSAKGVVKANASASSLNALLSKYGIKEAEELMPLTGSQVTPQRMRAKSLNGKEMPDGDLSSLYVLRFDPQKVNDINLVAKEFSELTDVEYAEPNYIVYACSTGTAEDYIADPMYSQQWGIPAIGLDKLWEAPVVNPKRPVIAILDTGVDITHPDLADNIWTNELEATGADNTDDDRNGFADDVHGWDFVNNSPRMRDNNGHGTHCAGIAAAVGGNGIGITGANPEALIMPITVMQSDGTGDIATIIKGIDYATANGADLLSMSFGSYYKSMAEHDALAKAYQKAVLVAAAGNDNLCIYPHACPITMKGGDTLFPAAYGFVLGVEASANTRGGMAIFSNYDDDGPILSKFDDLYNYELRAPGTSILSTFPNGQYKTLHGTSMACPLVAGAISRLMMTRKILSTEELFGDLIYSTKIIGKDIAGNDIKQTNIYDTYLLSDDDRKPTLSLVTYRLDDEKMGDADGRPDAGETIRIYPTFRNSWGYARNITYSIRVAENEDPDIVEFMDDESHFISNLSSYASAEAESPFILKINPNCVDGRHISLVVTATCDNISEPLEQEIVLDVENGVELGGILSEDMTLYADQHYIITSILAVPEGVTLTIQPGTIVKFKENTALNVEGNIIAKGTPDSRIVFTMANLGEYRAHSINISKENVLEYCEFNNLKMDYIIGNFANCLFSNNVTDFSSGMSNELYSAQKSAFYSNHTPSNSRWNLINTNISKNIGHWGSDGIKKIILCNSYSNITLNNELHSLWLSDVNINKFNAYYSYLGSENKKLLDKYVWDIHDNFGSFTELDFTSIVGQPIVENHGIVWKVLVNDYDAQDEYELLPPLGVGRHKFDVYFNRKMNHDKAPMIAMGVRDPYTQIAISEDGEWHTEMLPYNPLGNRRGSIDVNNGDFNVSNEHWVGKGCSLGSTTITTSDFDGKVLYSRNHKVGETIKLYQQIYGAQNGRYKLTISAKVNKLAENNDCQYVYLNDTKTYLDENALNGAVYEVIADVRDNFIEVGIEQTENIADNMYIDNVSLTLLEEYSNERMVPIDVYTAYLTIKGKDNFDGVNTIYVAEAEDDEYFPIPIENVRFHVNVQSAGSMSSGFMADPGVGKVTLTWENPEENFDDMLGYNLYRYTLDENYEPGDTIRLNEQLLDKEEFVDYDIVPGTTYNYYYKVLRTSLDENAPSKVVSATPRAAGKGDANASGDVDVADVVTEVNYMVGRDPKPFMFDAADVNDDSDIDILDVVGTINIIMSPQGGTDKVSSMSVATYSVEDGILYVESPIELAGMQAELSGNRDITEISVLPALKGMENTGEWVSDNLYRFVAFSLSGKTLESGEHALLSIGDAELSNLILVDEAGNRVIAVEGAHSGISSILMQQMKAPTPNPFVDEINVPVIIGTDGIHDVELSLHDLSGTTALSHHVKLGYGEHTVTLNGGSLSSGFYLLTLTVDGTAIQTHKVIKK